MSKRQNGDITKTLFMAIAIALIVVAGGLFSWFVEERLGNYIDVPAFQTKAWGLQDDLLRDPPGQLGKTSPPHVHVVIQPRPMRECLNESGGVLDEKTKKCVQGYRTVERIDDDDKAK